MRPPLRLSNRTTAALTGAGLTLACAMGLLWARSDSDGAPTKPACDRTIRPSSGAGNPHDDRTLQRFLATLKPGQTGCLHTGAYRGEVAVRGSAIALRPYPGERASIAGRLWFPSSAHDDAIVGLRLEGQNAAGLPSPTVNGSNIRFVGVDVTNGHTAICFDIGSPDYGRAYGTTIEHSRIHDCGRLPSNNTEHGIYVETADGTRIVSNLIYDNADRGIQLYPDAQHTSIERNVIDGNGEGIIFSGDGGQASSHNIVEHNLITNSAIRADVESWYPVGTPAGVGNVVRENCVFGGHGTIAPSGHGFAAAANVVANPRYANRAAGDFRIATSSPCARILRR